MVILKDKKALNFTSHTHQKLDEMATVCKRSDGYGIIIQIYSNDHAPAHAHVFDNTRKEIGKFELKESLPQKPQDLTLYQTTSIPTDTVDKIVKWANGKTKLCINNWLFARQTWINNNEA